MTEIKTYCDHCGKELEDGVDYIDVNLMGFIDYIGSVDICSECADELNNYIKSFLLSSRSKSINILMEDE